MNDKVRELVERWRKDARDHELNDDSASVMASIVYGRCASDLERAMGEQVRHHPMCDSVFGRDCSCGGIRRAAPPSDEGRAIITCGECESAEHDTNDCPHAIPPAAGGADECTCGKSPLHTKDCAMEIGIQPLRRAAAPVGEREEAATYENIADMLPSMLLKGTEVCPLCGKIGAHEHSPTEIVIYRNGVKYGQSLRSIESSEGALAMEWRAVPDPFPSDAAEECVQPWLEGTRSGGPAKYTVNYDAYGNYWVARWWHGNGAHSVDNWRHHLTARDAKEACRFHLERMRAALQAALRRG